MRRSKLTNRGGRPVRLTVAIAFKLGASLGRGQSVVDSARYAGVSAPTLYRWLALGRAGDPRYLALVNGVEELTAARMEQNALLERYGFKTTCR